MRLGHAAALALTGWYLMAPPVGASPEIGYYVDIRKPISAWRMLSPHDTAKECDEAARRALRTKIEQNGGKPIYSMPAPKTETELGLLLRKMQIESYYRAECIATDDPRLKEK